VFVTPEHRVVGAIATQVRAIKDLSVKDQK